MDQDKQFWMNILPTIVTIKKQKKHYYFIKRNANGEANVMHELNGKAYMKGVVSMPEELGGNQFKKIYRTWFQKGQTTQVSRTDLPSSLFGSICKNIRYEPIKKNGDGVVVPRQLKQCREGQPGAEVLKNKHLMRLAEATHNVMVYLLLKDYEQLKEVSKFQHSCEEALLVDNTFFHRNDASRENGEEL